MVADAPGVRYCHMRQTFKTYLVAAATLLALGVFGGTLVGGLYYAPDTEVPLPESLRGALNVEPTPVSEQPKRLTVPSLGIDADIQYVGVNAKGNMGVPSNFRDVAWYKYGTVPGQVGSAVIDGHVDNGLKLAGVFKKLDQIRVGDDVYVETKEGGALHFKVVEVVTYHYKDVPLEKLFNRADKRRLNLVTCGGSWIQGEKTYDERIVVYTVLVP